MGANDFNDSSRDAECKARRYGRGLQRVFTVALIAGALVPRDVAAEAGETAVGIETGILLPALSAQDPAAFRLVAWSVGGTFAYGLTDDLFLHGRSVVARFSGQTSSEQVRRGRPFSGQLFFELEQYELGLGLRYNLHAGYDIAPYAEVHAGFGWWIARGVHHVSDALGRIAQPDDGAGGLTLSAGLSIDHRWWNLFLVGVHARYAHVLGHDLVSAYVATAVRLRVYW